MTPRDVLRDLAFHRLLEVLDRRLWRGYFVLAMLLLILGAVIAVWPYLPSWGRDA